MCACKRWGAIVDGKSIDRVFRVILKTADNDVILCRRTGKGVAAQVYQHIGVTADVNSFLLGFFAAISAGYRQAQRVRGSLVCNIRMAGFIELRTKSAAGSVTPLNSVGFVSGFGFGRVLKVEPHRYGAAAVAVVTVSKTLIIVGIGNAGICTTTGRRL